MKMMITAQSRPTAERTDDLGVEILSPGCDEICVVHPRLEIWISEIVSEGAVEDQESRSSLVGFVTEPKDVESKVMWMLTQMLGKKDALYCWSAVWVSAVAAAG